MDEIDSQFINNKELDPKEFLKFKTVRDQIEADDYATLFEQADIPVLQTNNVSNLDQSFSGHSLNDSYFILIRLGDFEKARKILVDEADKIITELDQDYYLFDFSDKELTNILKKPDEWGEIDQRLAAQLLHKRGVIFKPEEIKSFETDRIETLKKPEDESSKLIVFGYILAILGPVIFVYSGFLSIFLGSLIMKMKRTLPNGEKVYAFSAKDRKHGLYILTIGAILCSVVAFAVFIAGFSPWYTYY
ncbi:MAG: hypothetical protein ACI9J3_000497 [Parvicellaceae bacterium]|jgi:hypothetical protein